MKVVSLQYPTFLWWQSVEVYFWPKIWRVLLIFVVVIEWIRLSKTLRGICIIYNSSRRSRLLSDKAALQPRSARYERIARSSIRDWIHNFQLVCPFGVVFLEKDLRHAQLCRAGTSLLTRCVISAVDNAGFERNSPRCNSHYINSEPRTYIFSPWTQEITATAVIFSLHQNCNHIHAKIKETMSFNQKSCFRTVDLIVTSVSNRRFFI